MKKISNLFFIFVFFIIIIPLTFAGTMTRTLSKQTVAPGEIFQLIYDSPTRDFAYWFYSEGLPEGFESISVTMLCGPWSPEEHYLLICRFEGQNAALPYSISIKASTVPGTYVFSEGYYNLWSTSTDPNPNLNLGNPLSITVTPGVCSSPNTPCPTGCFNLQTDKNHCGACTTACTSAQSCVAGVCTNACTSPNTQCSTGCFNLQTDKNHCGSCTNVCTGTQTCVAGVCKTSTCTESWTCGAWSDVEKSCGTRTCTDGNNCGTTASKPPTTKDCSEQPINPLYIVAGFIIVLMVFGMMSRRR